MLYWACEPFFSSGDVGTQTLFGDYNRYNECMEPVMFRMFHVYDIAPKLRHGDQILKEYLTEGYYHLRLR